MTALVVERDLIGLGLSNDCLDVVSGTLTL